MKIAIYDGRRKEYQGGPRELAEEIVATLSVNLKGRVRDFVREGAASEFAETLQKMEVEETTIFSLHSAPFEVGVNVGEKVKGSIKVCMLQKA